MVTFDSYTTKLLTVISAEIINSIIIILAFRNKTLQNTYYTMSLLNNAMAHLKFNKDLLENVVTFDTTIFLKCNIFSSIDGFCEYSFKFLTFFSIKH